MILGSSENKRLIMQLHHIWNTKDISFISEVYSLKVVVHWLKSNKKVISIGHTGVLQAIQDTLQAFPDWHEKIVDLVAEGDRVVTRYISSGTHKGIYQDIAPTNRKFIVDEISIFRVENNKVAEQWCLVDDRSLLNQIKCTS